MPKCTTRAGAARGKRRASSDFVYWLTATTPEARLKIVVVSSRARDLLDDGNRYHEDPPLTGDESVVAEVKNIAFPELLDPVDDHPPATIITALRPSGGKLLVAGVAHDDGEIAAVVVNGNQADIVSASAGVVDWTVTLDQKSATTIEAGAVDEAGNEEKTPHRVSWNTGT